MQLTPNFSMAEVWAHNSTPNEAQARTAYLLARLILQPLRDYINEPIRITSGFRPAPVAGGSATSEHLYIGQAGAVDINIGAKQTPARNLHAFNWLAENCRYSIGQLIYYTETTHLHISLAGKHQGQFLVCRSKANADYINIKRASEIQRYDPRLSA